MGIKERFDAFIKYKSLSRRKFQDAIGVSNSYIQNISKGISREVLNRISIQYPELDTNWLLTGVGEMLQSEERSEKIISVPQTAVSTKQRKGALIYDIDATCGLSGRDIEFTDEKVIGSIDAPEINPDSKIIFATGDSMLPLIASGDRVVIRKIESWDYFNYGQVYLIITNEYRLIKRVRRHPKDSDNLILLRSENPDYDDIDLPKREIIHLFIVENILSIKNIL
ncbi:S24 family peptidase [uncultured Bacteroides sp.]|uniref:S24 family peptidase n=1 Tax=uncultured Bacteroides sp. TaxID=162156 RepID=UPI00205D8AAB|nr:S24 family peptidase [uncultured Bacteroides sp.]DAO06451.1 MAG TPA: putative transcriptional regulator [Caudoviricetes sp.]